MKLDYTFTCVHKHSDQNPFFKFQACLNVDFLFIFFSNLQIRSGCQKNGSEATAETRAFVQRSGDYERLQAWKHSANVRSYFVSFIYIIIYFNNRFLRERGMASNPKMEYQVFLGIFQKNSAMATLGLKEMGKFLWEGREKGLSR